MVGKSVKPLQEFNHFVDSEGNIFNKKMKLRKQVLNKSCGYYQITLRLNKLPIVKYTHRLVYEAFYGNIPEGCQIHHIDGDKLNNRVVNLELKNKTRHYLEHRSKSVDHNIYKYSSKGYQVIVKHVYYGTFYSLDKAREVRDTIHAEEINKEQVHR